MAESLRKLRYLLNKKDKKKMLIILWMMVIAALLETVGIGLIIPLAGILTDTSVIHTNNALSSIFDFLNFKSETSFLIFAVSTLLFVFVFKNIYLGFYNYIQINVVMNQQVSIAKRLFQEYLKKPYTFHLQRNTSDLLRNVSSEVPRLLQGVVIAGFQLLTELLIITCILSLLLFTAPLATIVAAVFLGSGVVLFFWLFKKKITAMGKEYQEASSELIKWINQGFGAGKEIKVLGKETFFISKFNIHSEKKAANSKYMKMLDQIPRLFIETILVSAVLSTMLVIVLNGSSTVNIVSTMALFAMASFRLMPSITRVVSLITTIRHSQPALNVVYDDLIGSIQNVSETIKVDEEKLFNQNEKVFTHSIELESVSFSYPDQNENTIKNISLSIPIGKSVAFVGESGAGKTTVVDMILGLLSPDKGRVLVDHSPLDSIKYKWQRKIGYIPQFIFLSDDTIRSNVAFGVEEEEIDDTQVWLALEQAQLKDFVMQLPYKLETQIGEQGVRLSGGQRQRIGIARALYHNPEILFMDEATSSLDTNTEKEIIKSIDSLKGEKTLIIIAHRLSTIENCDIIYHISNGKLKSTTHKNRILNSTAAL